MRALVTGATGFVGRKLLAKLQRPVVLSRDAVTASARLGPEARVFPWNSSQEPAPKDAFQDVDVVFHLAGESVAEGRWTTAKKARIRDSRVVGTRNLVDTIRRLDRKPSVLVAASAIGYYGDCGDKILDETAPPARDFLGEVCAAWEREARAVTEFGVRVVNVRLGLVLGRDGGALSKMLTPFRLGLGSPLGSGCQWMSWVHLDDVIGVLLLAAERTDLQGPLNATAPYPVTNREFTKALGRAVHRPTLLPAVPATVLRWSLGELAGVILASQRVLPRHAQAAGYSFAYPNLEEALRDLV